MAQSGVTERPGRLQVEQMAGGAIVGEPEVPQPSIV